MYIFLDIDGVLKPIGSSSSPVFNKECLKCFEDVIRANDNVKIVISSTWKLAFSLREIKQFFSPDIQKLIVGMTPDSMGMIIPYERHKEVLAYLKQNDNENAKWLAIDDDPEHFPKKCTVILTEPYIGFNHISALEMREILKD